MAETTLRVREPSRPVEMSRIACSSQEDRRGRPTGSSNRRVSPWKRGHPVGTAAQNPANLIGYFSVTGFRNRWGRRDNVHRLGEDIRGSALLHEQIAQIARLEFQGTPRSEPMLPERSVRQALWPLTSGARHSQHHCRTYADDDRFFCANAAASSAASRPLAAAASESSECEPTQSPAM